MAFFHPLPDAIHHRCPNGSLQRLAGHVLAFRVHQGTHDDVAVAGNIKGERLLAVIGGPTLHANDMPCVATAPDE
jgi:hypothetical protein